MSRNLEKFNRSSNADWCNWCKVVKKVYKAQGVNLTQQQTLILARDNYPGKGNVTNKKQNILEQKVVVKQQIPVNPVRQKRAPLPKEKPPVYKREKSPVYKKIPPKLKDKESDEEERPRKKTVSRNKKNDSPLKRRPKKKYYYSSSSDSEEEYEYVKMRKRRE